MACKCLLLTLPACLLAAAENSPEFLDLFAGGAGGYHTYRIPALLVTGRGPVLAFCEGRKNSPRDDGDIDLLMRRSTDGGRTWEPQRVVHEEGGSAGITIGNPAPVLDRKSGAIHLLFTRNNQRLFVLRSEDDGKTWSRPRELTAILKDVPFPWTRIGAGPGHGIQLRSGRLLVPIWLNERIRVNYRSAAVYSDDGGKTWRAGGMVGPEAPDSNECMLFERSDGAVVMNMRSKWRERAISISRDGGLTWSPPTPVKELPDPVCQASVLSVDGPGGAPRVIFANAADSNQRVNLTVRLSLDDGATWSASRVLEPGPSAYSDLAQTNEGVLLCLFERGEKTYREMLRLARFPLGWQESSPPRAAR